MMIFPSHTDSIKAFKSWLEKRKGDYEAILKTIEPSSRELTIWPYFSMAFDTDCMPLIMLQQTRTAYDWLSLDTGSGPYIRLEFSTVIWGLVAGYKDEVNNDMAVALAGAIAETLNRKHESFDYEGNTYVFYETCPISETTYGVMPLRPNVASGFNQMIRVSVDVNAPQIRD